MQFYQKFVTVCCTLVSCVLFLRLVIYGIGIFCFFLHVSDSWEKYTSKATTFSSGYVIDKDLKLPQIALCSRTNFNDTALQILNINKDFFNKIAVSNESWKTFDSRQELENAWNSSAILVHEAATDITFRTKVSGNWTFNNIFSNEMSTFNSFAYGRCSNFRNFDNVFTSNSDSLTFNLNLSAIGSPEIDVWISEAGSEIFGTVGMFVGDISMFTTQPGNIYAFYIKKRKTNFRSTAKFNCSQDITFFNYSRCLQDFVTKQLEIKGQSIPGLPCYFPYFHKFVRDDTPPCKSLAQLETMDFNIKEFGEHFTNNLVTGCQEPCTKQEYIINTRSVPAAATRHNSARIIASFVYQEIRIEERDEYVLFDFGAIIGSIGGSLGLFLGLSFADFCMMTIMFVQKHLIARCDKNRRNSVNCTLKSSDL